MKVTCKIENGNKVWRNENDKIHRKKGPAIEYANGDKYWLQNGLFHRVGGPAVEFANGRKEWWFEGEEIDCNSQEDFESIVEAQKNMQYILQQIYGDKFSLQLQFN